MNTAEYIKETRAEMKHVTWPSRRQSIIYTVVVIVISVVTGLFLGFFDFIFTQILGKII